ncbi:FAD-dependent oxidoreductase [Dictyobacter aurantiacus]|uniref:FAD-binding dehydrogenase n=1 Tax=Dictyobacter aurantiacus TaxID=1936993 RepID=A0A401ZRB5_9CHLR|nr:FAD-dependent oxidoreductase [Dictyobacter aurantiacus]GCE09401.1 hypothetical protein KDAU_67300 [Dictyobacter aurantiacus]
MFVKSDATTRGRSLQNQRVTSDLVIIGGGLSGTCCAITAARAGLQVVLIQDRPVLGGNASSEVRLWVLGATSHMNNNNRWSREGGVIDELLVENLYRNPEGNPHIFDTIILDAVVNEPNITLLLNTALIDIEKDAPDRIRGVRAFCSQNSTMYTVWAPLFCDASGDGILSFLAGAAFRMGAEARSEFDEKFAPSKEYGELLGHSLYFYSKDTGKPVHFIPPSYALKDITQIPRYQQFKSNEYGCNLWWIEYGGRLDTVHDTEKIKWELWRIVYGIWDYIKNSGQFPEAETLTLEWVGMLPGKRESRRFEGPYMLCQQDIVEQREYKDVVGFGGWSIDLHPADGIFSERPGCNQWHARGVYQIPYRCLYSKDIQNLFFAGRSISASHVAFGSTRVMATCAHSAQAVGMAAALCRREGLLPAQIGEEARIQHLQRELLRRGQYLPGLALHDPSDLVAQGTICASSSLVLAEIEKGGPVEPLTRSRAQMLPVTSGTLPTVSFLLDVSHATTLQVEVRTSDRPSNYTPDVVLEKHAIELAEGKKQRVAIPCSTHIDTNRYVFFCLLQNEHIAVHTSLQRFTGLLALEQRDVQSPPEDIGIEAFEFWCPSRRPHGQNLAITIEPPLTNFQARLIANGNDRPTVEANAWVAALEDPQPCLSVRWETQQRIAQVDLVFDTDSDHAMESVLKTHAERAIPFCVKHYRLRDQQGKILEERDHNYQTRNTIVFDTPISTDQLSLEVLASHGNVPAAVFAMRCYEQPWVVSM